MSDVNSDTAMTNKEFIEKLGGMRMTAVGPEFLEEIGRIVANFALLEYEIFLLIHGLLGTEDDVSRIITTELAFKNLLDLSASLVLRVHGEAAIKQYRDVLKIVSGAEEQRNLVVHSIWGGKSKTVIRSKTTAKRSKGLNTQHVEYTKADLAEIGLVVSRAILTVELFRKRLGYDEWV